MPDKPAPFLWILHFDAGDSTDPQRMYEEGPDNGSIDLQQTEIPFDNDLFQAFSDFRIDLTRRGYAFERFEMWKAWPDAPEN